MSTTQQAPQRTGTPVYCPHGRFGVVDPSLRDGSNCEWSYDRNDKRGEGFLGVHLRIIHKGVDPRTAVAATPSAPPPAAASTSVSAETKKPAAKRGIVTPERVEEVCEALRATSVDLGYVPSRADWKRGGYQPSAEIIDKCCGTFKGALRRAGLPVRSGARSAPIPWPQTGVPAQTVVAPEPTVEAPSVELAVVQKEKPSESIDIGRILHDGNYSEDADQVRSLSDLLRRRSDALVKIADGLEDLAATES